MSAPSGPVRLGLVGCGRLAEAGYLPALAAAPAARLVAVADPDPARRARVADLAAVGVRTFADAAALLDGAEVDALVLASPAAAHVADARSATAAGVRVLVEKPPAPDAAGAAALAALDPPPWVGFNRRFDPGARAARDAVPAAGPLSLRLELRYRRRSWGAHSVRDDALTDLGPHLVDWARWLGAGEAVEVVAPEVSHDRAAVELTTTRGRVGIRVAADRPHAERIEVRDGSGRLVARHRVGGLGAAVRGRLRPGPSPLVESLAGQLRAFAAAVRGEPRPELATAADGLAAMRVLDAARTSAARGGAPVTVASDVNEVNEVKG